MPLTLTRVNHGTVAGDGLGDVAFDAFQDVNTTFDAIKVIVDANESAVASALQTADIDTLAELNAIIGDATLIDTSDSRLSDARTPTAHTIGSHSASNLAALNAIISDATLIDTGDSRLSDARTPTSHTILSHDTDTTGAELTALADNSSGDGKHWHSKLFESDGGAEAVSVSATGSVGIGNTSLEAWQAAYVALQIGGNFNIMSNRTESGSHDVYLNSNIYFDGSFRHQATGPAAQYSLVDGKHVFRVVASGTADAALTTIDALTVENNADVTVDTGNLIIGTADKGIDFSATSDAAGSTSELFDDYEEGDWTPRWWAASTSWTTENQNVQDGKYVKNGSVVILTGYLSSTELLGGTGPMQMLGAPYPINGWVGGFISTSQNFAGDHPSGFQRVASGSALLYAIYRTASNGATATLNRTDMNNAAGNDIEFTIVYITNT